MQAHLAALLPEAGGLRLIFADEAPDIFHDDHGSGEGRRIKIGQGDSMVGTNSAHWRALKTTSRDNLSSAVLFPIRRGANAAIIRINRGIVPPPPDQPRAMGSIHV